MLAYKPDRAKKRIRPDLASRTGWLAYAYLLAVLAGSLLLTLLIHPPHDTQHWLFDLVTSTFSTRLKSQNQNIVLVYVSAATLPPDQYPYLSPIDRGLLADVINAIDNAGAKVIGLDIILDRHTELTKDNRLRETIRHTKAKMVLGAVDEAGTGSHVQSKFFLAKDGDRAPDLGNLYLETEHTSLVVSGHVIRFMSPPDEMITFPDGRKIRKSFAHALAAANGVNIDAHAPWMDWLLPPSPRIDWLLPPNVDKHFDPRPEYKAWIMSSRHEVDPFLALPANEILAKPEVSSLLRDKIVIIGVNFDDRDQHLTPLSVSRDVFYTGAFIHAQILAQLLDRRSIYEMAFLMKLLVAAGVGYAAYWFGRRPSHFHFWFELSSVLALVIVSVLLFAYLKIMLPYTLLLFFFLVGSAIGHYGRKREAAQDSE